MNKAKEHVFRGQSLNFRLKLYYITKFILKGCRCSTHVEFLKCQWKYSNEFNILQIKL